MSPKRSLLGKQNLMKNGKSMQSLTNSGNLERPERNEIISS
ncbi:hypothetical protein LINPERHAP1_LOCUS4335, partial [Linum perenne]